MSAIESTKIDPLENPGQLAALRADCDHPPFVSIRYERVLAFARRSGAMRPRR